MIGSSLSNRTVLYHRESFPCKVVFLGLQGSVRPAFQCIGATVFRETTLFCEIATHGVRIQNNAAMFL